MRGWLNPGVSLQSPSAPWVLRQCGKRTQEALVIWLSFGCLGRCEVFLEPVLPHVFAQERWAQPRMWLHPGLQLEVNGGKKVQRAGVETAELHVRGPSVGWGSLWLAGRY